MTVRPFDKGTEHMEALTDFPYAPDGINKVEITEGQTFEAPLDTVANLEKNKLAKKTPRPRQEPQVETPEKGGAPEGIERAAHGPAGLERTVAAVVGSTGHQELDPSPESVEAAQATAAVNMGPGTDQRLNAPPGRYGGLELGASNPGPTIDPAAAAASIQVTDRPAQEGAGNEAGAGSERPTSEARTDAEGSTRAPGKKAKQSK